MREFGECQTKYLGFLQNQNDNWKRKANENWYSGGDRNTRFFHTSVNRRQMRNAIAHLRNSSWDLVTGEDEMGEIMISYFSHLFKTIEGDDKLVLKCVECTVTKEHNRESCKASLG